MLEGAVKKRSGGVADGRGEFGRGTTTISARSGRTWTSAPRLPLNIDVSLLRARARDDDPEAQYELGLRYTEGDGVPASDTTAHRWLARAAEAGHADAMAAVGRCLHDGAGVPADLVLAGRWYERALASGSELAFADLGRLLSEDDPNVRDVDRAREVLERGWEQHGDEACAGLLADLLEDAYGDAEGSIKWARIAAAEGDSASMVTLGFRHRYGLGLPRDFDAMVRWYREAAALGHASALTNLALCYQKGEGVRADEARAFELMEQAATLGHGQAASWVAFAHIDGVGCEPDPERGRELLEELAEDDPEVAHDLADRLIDGPGLERDVRAGLRWMRRAADEGYAAAYTYLGVLHWYGKHVDRDHGRALDMYRRASALGDPYGTANIGFALLEGEGIERDVERGLSMIERAGEEGNAHAALWIAQRRLEGDDNVPQDAAAAVRVLERCADLDEDGDVLFLLAELVRDGRGVESDPERALGLFTLARLDGRDTRVEEAQLRRLLRRG